jgi:hypothetical protein
MTYCFRSPSWTSLSLLQKCIRDGLHSPSVASRGVPASCWFFVVLKEKSWICFLILYLPSIYLFLLKKKCSFHLRDSISFLWISWDFWGFFVFSVLFLLLLKWFQLFLKDALTGNLFLQGELPAIVELLSNVVSIMAPSCRDTYTWFTSGVNFSPPGLISPHNP